MTYAERTRRPPRTLTDAEQKKLLGVTGRIADGFRDHVLLSVALGTALRESEIVALDCGDVFNANGKTRQRVQLRVFKRAGENNSSPEHQRVFVPDALRYKLDKYRRWKKARGESVDADAPLFLSRRLQRLSTRRVRSMFQAWQREAGFSEPLFRFHHLRHTSLTNVYRATKDIRVVSAIARHGNINTTTIYASPSDENMVDAVKGLQC